MNENEHVCTRCKQNKTEEEMSKDTNRKKGISSWCKSCRTSSAKTWKNNNPNRLTKRNSPTYEVARNYILKHRYGISGEDYSNLLKQQNNCCAICKRNINQITYHLHVDHCHTTGEVRGLLCAPCNRYLGYIKDDKTILNTAILYLKERYNK